ncbi:MAG TPA: glycosyltransferase family 4 protein [Solirubrobacteraceae bacterium]|nr:glycosyltransferase family 4 protein [Solirubrobacteraceae bacterium]
MRVDIVDPSAFTPPYDDALCAALAAAGADVELVTSRFAYGEVPDSGGYTRREDFYRHAARVSSPRLRRAAKLAEHIPDMLRYRARARSADVVHFQWLALPPVDGLLLPDRPRVITAHDILPREGGALRRQAQRRLYARFDAVVVHSEHGRGRLVALGVERSRIHVIPHGALAHLGSAAPPAAGEQPVVVFAGLMRPYKGIDVLLRAWRGIDGARLIVAGMPRMDTAPLRALAGPGVELRERYLPDDELAALLREAAIVVLPYREADQSGVALTALALGRPLLLSDVGGFPELAATGAAETVPAGDAAALHDALARLLADAPRRAAMSAAAAAAAAGNYSWSAVARATLGVYESVAGKGS